MYVYFMYNKLEESLKRNTEKMRGTNNKNINSKFPFEWWIFDDISIYAYTQTHNG